MWVQSCKTRLDSTRHTSTGCPARGYGPLPSHTCTCQGAEVGGVDDSGVLQGDQLSRGEGPGTPCRPLALGAATCRCSRCCSRCCSRRGGCRAAGSAGPANQAADIKKAGLVIIAGCVARGERRVGKKVCVHRQNNARCPAAAAATCWWVAARFTARGPPVSSRLLSTGLLATLWILLPFLWTCAVSGGQGYGPALSVAGRRGRHLLALHGPQGRPSRPPAVAVRGSWGQGRSAQ